MSVAVWSGSLVAWERELAALKGRIGPVFGRAEVRETAGAFLDGLLSGVARKTGWLLAEQAGLDRPYRMQSLLGRSRWDADALRDRIRADVIEALGDADGVLVVDETGFLKKGEHSVGVARQSYYFAFAPVGVSLGELAGAAGLRWTIEECFERAKDDLGLDHCEARSWHGWHRHMSLCLAAAAFLARLAADLRRATWGKANERSPAVPAAA